MLWNMSNGNGGLNETKRKWLNIIVSSIISVNAALAGIAASNAVVVPPLVYVGLAIATLIAWNINSQYAMMADKVAAKSGP